MQLLESGEMYLETILVLTEGVGSVRSVDIVNYTGYAKPSISRAVGLLKEGGYINVTRDGAITLTKIGLEIAKRIYDRHNLLTQFFEEIGVDRITATTDACKIEHVISEETFEKIKEHVIKIKGNT